MRRRAYHCRDQFRQFLLINFTIIGDVVPEHIEMKVSREERCVHLHVEGDGETIVKVTLAGSGDSQEEFIEIDGSVIVGIERIEGVSSQRSW